MSRAVKLLNRAPFRKAAIMPTFMWLLLEFSSAYIVAITASVALKPSR